MYDDKIIGANIKNARLYRNYSQDYLAGKLNISQNAYSKVELGYTKITLHRLLFIADLLLVEPTRLMEQSPIHPDVKKVSEIHLVKKLLETICVATGMGFSAIARVTEDKWIACSVCDKIQFGLEAGGELRLETTICNEIRQHGKAVVISNVDNDAGFANHLTPELYGFKSYISMPILRQDGSFFGTLCAIDPKPANLNNPQTIGMFKSFAELISFHLNAVEQTFYLAIT
jgi:DNA-binding XRE family transcriptional regulator